MARTKKNTAKEPVRVRTKDLANGNKSLYLDIYVDGVRSYEFLKLYIVPETSAAAKVANKNTMQAANAIKARRILDIANGAAGITKATGTNVLFTDFVREVIREKKTVKRYGTTIDATLKHLIAYKGEKLTVSQINTNYVRGFVVYLEKSINTHGGNLSNNTKALYCKCLYTVLNDAVRKGFLQSNPMDALSTDEKPHFRDPGREYLTVDEVKAMAGAYCKRDEVKRAFMFACFCGLRLSDIIGLTWGQLSKDGQQWRASVKMQKTGAPLMLPLSAEAVRWLPERDGARDIDNVFEFPSNPAVERAIKAWAEGAGIKKRVTFHVSRHTFATLALTAGADLYTTSKLLGHADISTTQIYAKVIDSKKDEAVNAVSSLFG